MEVEDDVAFPEGKPQTAAFRWHLGTREDVTVSGSGKEYRVIWKDAEMTLSSSIPITVTTELFPDNTVNLGEKVGPDYLHRCVVVRMTEPGEAWKMETIVKGK